MELVTKSSVRLGFDERDSKNLVEALNKLLANYQIHYHKLRNFHWSVEGADFFELHEQFELEYNRVKTYIDEIAERIRVFGKMPFRTLEAYLQHADIVETRENLSSKQMVAEIINDFEILLEHIISVTDLAKEMGDTASLDMVTNYLKETEKRLWMFSAWMK